MVSRWSNDVNRSRTSITSLCIRCNYKFPSKRQIYTKVKRNLQHRSQGKQSSDWCHKARNQMDWNAFTCWKNHFGRAIKAWVNQRRFWHWKVDRAKSWIYFLTSWTRSFNRIRCSWCWWLPWWKDTCSYIITWFKKFKNC